MNGFRFVPLLFITALNMAALSFSATSAFAKDQCAWSCGRISQTEKNSKLKSHADQVTSFLAGESSCALVEGFDHEDRGIHAGALQTLAAAKQNCSVPNVIKSKNNKFLYDAMRFQGLKLSAESKSFRPKDFEPAQIYNHLDQSNCLYPVSDSENLNPGDLIVSKDDVVIVDSIDADPFGIETKIRESVKLLKQEGEFKEIPNFSVVLEHAKRVCESWVNDPSQFKISVFHARGRSSFFPTYGKSTSPWVTLISERATFACVNRVSEEIARFAEVPFPLRDSEPILPKSALLVVRHDSSTTACRMAREQMPKSHDLDCVQCCDFTPQEAAK